MENVILSAAFTEESVGKTEHFHDCHQIIYLEEGEAEIIINGRKYTASAGSAAIISRFEMHSVAIKSAACPRYLLRISPTPVPGIDAHLFSVLVNRPVGFDHVFPLQNDKDTVSGLLKRIVSEAAGTKPDHTAMENLLFSELLIYIFRDNPRLFVSAASTNLSTVDQIKELFESADSAPYTLESLADRFHLSPFYLSHLFKNVTGISVMNYLLSCRMAHAKRLLADSDCSVDKIVSSCGFSDASNFCRIFKKQTGMTPGMFRKLNRH